MTFLTPSLLISDDLPSEPFAIGPVQFSRPRGAAENWFAKLGFWEHFVSFSSEKQQNTEFSPDPGNLLNLIFRDWPRSV